VAAGDHAVDDVGDHARHLREDHHNRSRQEHAGDDVVRPFPQDCHPSFIHSKQL
jgi:hypothetical protein